VPGPRLTQQQASAKKSGAANGAPPRAQKKTLRTEHAPTSPSERPSYAGDALAEARGRTLPGLRFFSLVSGSPPPRSPALLSAALAPAHVRGIGERCTVWAGPSPEWRRRGAPPFGHTYPALLGPLVADSTLRTPHCGILGHICGCLAVFAAMRRLHTVGSTPWEPIQVIIRERAYQAAGGAGPWCAGTVKETVRRLRAAIRYRMNSGTVFRYV
jgi:hypothetical protein